MKNINRLKISIKLQNKHEQTYKTSSCKKRKIFKIASDKKWESAYLKVRYSEDLINEGIYYNLHDLVFALRCFTERGLYES